jgi:hypothetical protein
MKWLIFAVTMVAFPASAQSFNQIWDNRVVMAITPAAQSFDEQQFEREVNKRSVRQIFRKEANSSCLTLREARKIYGDRKYLSWRKNHCWYAPR